MPDKIDLKRALTIGTLSTNETETLPLTVLSQPIIDKLVTQLVDYNNPIRQNMPRKKGSGYAWHLNRRSETGQTYYAFTNDTQTFEIYEGTGAYEQFDFVYKTIGAQGKVTRKAQAVGQSYTNILADELEAKAMEFRDKEDWAMLWGYSGSTYIGYAANSWNGLYHLADDSNNRFAGVGAAGNTSLLTLDLLDQAMDSIRGNCDMIITSKKGKRIINSLLQQYQRFNDKIEVKGGFKVLSYNDVPIFTSSNIGEAQCLGTTCKGGYPGLTALTGGQQTSIFFLDTSKVFMGVLTEITVQPLAKNTSQYDIFDIYCDEVVVCRDPRAISLIHCSGK